MENLFNMNGNAAAFESESDAISGQAGDRPLTFADVEEFENGSPEGEFPEIGNANASDEPTFEETGEKRFQFWQSKADKFKNEVKSKEQLLQQQNEIIQELTQRTQQFQAYEPVLRMITSNPQILTGLMNPGQGYVQQPQQQEQERLPEKPKPPQRPTNFSWADAENPESATYKYLTEKEQYENQLADYLDRKNALLEKTLTAFQSQQQEALEVQQNINTIKAYLKQNYRFSDAQAEHFIGTMSGPNSMSLDNMVKYYMVLNNKNTNYNPAARPAFVPGQQTFKKPMSPAPIGTQMSGGGVGADPNQAFSLSLLAHAAKGGRLY